MKKDNAAGKTRIGNIERVPQPSIRPDGHKRICRMDFSTSVFTNKLARPYPKQCTRHVKQNSKQNAAHAAINEKFIRKPARREKHKGNCESP